LVGKGITFDTGGISIKPADGMERMKDDMAGGAAVVCAMRAMAMLNAPMRVIGIVPATENMPGGGALKPGDILTAASGKTVEVINTDAEGRLILGDGLWYAQKLGATHLVDVATLTGACVVALGKAASGLFGQPQAWVDRVHRTALAAGDRCWPMPLYDEYADQMKSEIADLVNSGGRPAGACTAASFLKEFAGDVPWVHLDVAGTAWADDAKAWQPKGATGVAVRTLAELAFTSVDWT
jgi:leucyl aminopeptidase